MTQISTGVSNSTPLMKPCSVAPTTAAGRNAITMPSAKRRAAGSLGSRIKTLHSFEK